MPTDPSDLKVAEILRRAMSLHERGRLDEADVGYAEVIGVVPDHEQALRLHGVLHRQRGDFAASVTSLQVAVEIRPDNAAALNELALSHAAMGDVHAAEAALRDILDIDPESRRALANLAALLQRCGHLEEAIALHQRYLELEPTDLEVRSNLANALMDAGRAEAALATCESALAMSPGHPLLLANQGAVLVGLERYADAIEVLEVAVGANATDDLAWLNLAYAQRALGQTDAALTVLQSAVRLSPDNARAASDLANILVETADIERALEICERFLRIHPGERLVLGTYASVLRDAGREAEASRILDYPSLVRTVNVDIPEGYASIDEFNADLASYVSGHGSLLRDPVRKSTRGGAQTGELDPAEAPVIEALDTMIRRAVEGVIADLNADGFSEHEVMAYATETWSLRTWATVLESGGMQSAHQHPLGWLSGVYYAQLPESVKSAAEGQGQLEFGSLPEAMWTTADSLLFPVKPREGQMIIFPSWFYHATRAFAGDKSRISIAFDVIPRVTGRPLASESGRSPGAQSI